MQYFFFLLIIYLGWQKPVLAKYENYAALAVNLADNDILYVQNPDKKVYLASLTKLMTLYLAFEAIKDGRISLYDKIAVSPLAASQVEKKIHLIAGKKYTFKELIFATAIFSANDATVAIAEELSGNIEDFTYLMNQKAVQLGLNGTHYVNPTGLTVRNSQEQNYTIPKDVVMLAKKLQADFPQYYPILGMEVFAQNGKIYGNGNKLLKFFKGLNGSKTGYTDLSGYNLFCSFGYHDYNIMVVIFGMSSLVERQKHMQEILNYSIKKILHSKKVKDPSNNEMTWEYDLFLKHSYNIQEKHGLYWYIINNLIAKNSKFSISEQTKQSSLSLLNEALSEITVFGDLVSHPLPMLYDDN